MGKKKSVLTDAQLALKQRVMDVYHCPYGFRYHHPGWPKSLWSKSALDIQEFLESRFEKTLDVIEYYSSVVYLYKTVPNESLLVEFHDSPQWLEVARTYEHLTGNTSLAGRRPKTVGISGSVQTAIGVLGSVPTLGGL